MLLHTEYSLLSLLHTQDGVVHHHGLFQVSGASPAPTPAGTAGAVSHALPQSPCMQSSRASWQAAWRSGQHSALLPQWWQPSGNAPRLQAFFEEPLFREKKKAGSYLKTRALSSYVVRNQPG